WCVLASSLGLPKRIATLGGPDQGFPFFHVVLIAPGRRWAADSVQRYPARSVDFVLIYRRDQPHRRDRSSLPTGHCTTARTPGAVGTCFVTKSAPRISKSANAE